MDSVSKKILSDPFIPYNLNHLEKILIKCLLQINIFWDMKLEWFQRIVNIMIINLLFHFSVVMILLWFINILKEILEFGVESSWKELNIKILLPINISWRKTSKSEKPYKLVFIVSNSWEPMNLLIIIWRKDLIFSEKLILSMFFLKLKNSLLIIRLLMISWYNLWKN